MTQSIAKKGAAARRDQFNNVSVGTANQGTHQILLPDGMSIPKAIKWLRRRHEELESEVTVTEIIDGYPLDALHAFAHAMNTKYGWTNLVPTPGFFGSTPPKMVGVQTGPDSSIQVPMGRMQIPGVEGYLDTGLDLKNGQPVLKLAATVKRKHEVEIHELANLTRKVLSERSIYRGQAIRVSFKKVANYEQLSETPLSDFEPEFLDTSTTREQLIFSDDVYDQIDTNVFSVIEHTDVLRREGMDIKRGVCLAGPYGTGKSMTAKVCANLCVRNDWTFLYIRSVDQLADAIDFARMYQPAVVFAEDIDQALGTDDRDERVNSILNVIDGVDTKHQDVMVVLTTNHVERLNKALLRPGRLDAVIPVMPPDAAACVRLVRLYGSDMIPMSEDLEQVGQLLAAEGAIPAVIAEVVKRSKLAAIKRTKGAGKLQVLAEDLLVASRGMTSHLALLEPVEKDTRDPIEKGLGHVAHAIERATGVTPNGENKSQRLRPEIAKHFGVSEGANRF